MSITIRNESISVLLRGYAVTTNGLVVWMEFPPQHPKAVGAIRAQMVNGRRVYLHLSDSEQGVNKPVYGLGRGYLTLTADAPALAVGHGARAELVRLIAPEAVRPDDPLGEDFYVLTWPGMDAATALAAMLENYSFLPVRIEWGAYLLQAALDGGYAEPLITGGAAPTGYAIEGGSPWEDIISQGVRKGVISLTD